MTNAEFTDITASDWRTARYLLNHCKAVDSSRNKLYVNELPYAIDMEPRRRGAGRGGSPPPFPGRWLSTVRISALAWLRIVDRYINDEPAASIASDIGISYPIVVKAFDTIQTAIASSPEDRTARGSDEAENSAVYGIRPSEGGDTSLEEIAQDRILIKLDFPHARLIFTRKEMEYRSLWWSRNVLEIADPGRLSSFYRIFSSDMEFWSYEKERLLRYHGVSFDRLSLYVEEIKEIGFKWTHRGEPLFDAVIGRLCDYAPDSVSAQIS